MNFAFGLKYVLIINLIEWMENACGWNKFAANFAAGNQDY